MANTPKKPYFVNAEILTPKIQNTPLEPTEGRPPEKKDRGVKRRQFLGRQ